MGRKRGSVNHIWSDWEDQKLRSNAEKGATWLAKFIGVSKMSVYARAYRLNIKITQPRSEINEAPRPICDICKVRPVGSKGYGPRGNRRWQRICSGCKDRSYTRHKKDKCELCGFQPEWKGQLDIDHIDGNRHNNDIENLQTLCANCHRLKTHISGDNGKRYAS